MKHIAIFASGKGTNAENIIRHFEGKGKAKVTLLVANKACPAVEKAVLLNVPVLILDRPAFYGEEGFIRKLHAGRVELIVLAGFLQLIPPDLIKAFPKRIINIHPALLPKFGGKGMYGKHVHEAVIAAKEKESGISIHLVNEKFDAGTIIFQAKCSVNPADTSGSLAASVGVLERLHYPVQIEKYLLSLP